MEQHIYRAIKDYTQGQVIGTHDIPTTLMLCDLRQGKIQPKVKEVAEQFKQLNSDIGVSLPMEIREIYFPFRTFKEKVMRVASLLIHMEVRREILLEEAARNSCPPGELQYYYAVANSAWGSYRTDCAPSKAPDKKECILLEAYHITGRCIGSTIMYFERDRDKKKKFKKRNTIMTFGEELDSTPPDGKLPSVFALRDHHRNYEKSWLHDYDEMIEGGIAYFRDKGEELFAEENPAVYVVVHGEMDAKAA